MSSNSLVNPNKILTTSLKPFPHLFFLLYSLISLHDVEVHQNLFFFNFSGLIGQNWSMIFAGSGFNVVIFDVDSGQLERAKTNISSTLKRYEKDGFMRGSGTSTEQAGRVSTSTSLEECLTGAFYVQVKHEITIFKIGIYTTNVNCTESVHGTMSMY